MILFTTLINLLHTYFSCWSHTLNMPIQCRRDEAHIGKFGHHQSNAPQITREYSEGSPMMLRRPSKNGITLMDCYFIYAL
jgi:hypothetical protein